MIVADYSEVVIVFGTLVVETVVFVVNADVGNVGAVSIAGVVQIVSAVWTAVVLVTASDLVVSVSVGNVDAAETVIVAHVFEMFVMTLYVFVARNFVVLIAAGKTVLTLESVVQFENLLDDTDYLVFCLVAAD